MAINLISYWQMEENGASNRVDSHGSNHLVAQNSPGRTTGKQGFGVLTDAAVPSWLGAASNASLQTGNIDFGFAFWYERQLATGGVLIAKDGADGSRDYTIDIFGDFRFYIAGGSTAIVTTAAPGHGGDLRFVVCWHDATADTLNIQIENGAVASAGTSGTVPDVSSSIFSIAARERAGEESFISLLIDEVAFFKSVPDATERSWMYNAGAGRTYAEWAALSASGQPKRTAHMFNLMRG